MNFCKNMFSHLFFVFLWMACLTPVSFSQESDSVDVAFFYTPSGQASIVYLPGEFNNWGDNVGGRITDSRFAMTPVEGTSIWAKTVRLRVGGPDPLPEPGSSIAGAYQYKFNENGSSSGWFSDPLNPRKNTGGNNNSYLSIHNPTIHYLQPNSLSGIFISSTPSITAYIFPSTSTTIEANSIRVVLGDTVYTNVGENYNPGNHFFSFIPPEPLLSGNHSLKLTAQSSDGSVSEDSTTFIVQAGIVQLLTQSNERHMRTTKTIVGLVRIPAAQVTLIQNDTDSMLVTAGIDGRFELGVDLREGANTFRARVIDGGGASHESGAITINYVIEHAPKPVVFINRSGENSLSLTFAANDPDGDAVSVTWTSDDSLNPEPLSIQSSDERVDFSIPRTPGEYFFDLVVTDPNSNVGTGRNYFTIDARGGLSFSGVNKNPRWVRDAIIYEIYVPAFTSEGTLIAAKERLQTIKDLGVNVIWLMPIFENGESINQLNAGFNITDFFKVHPQLGGNAAFESFLAEAHELGIRVILDSTPNHVSGRHEWVSDVELFGEFSNYRLFLENRIIGDNRGLGQFPTRVGNEVVYVHYSNWALANLNFNSIETVDFMLDMYKYWVLEVGIDGYRMDVYWGPQNRYGKAAWWRPFREEMKRVRPDVFVLSETDGTGPGSENNYADFGGASDAAYDWIFFGNMKNTLRGGDLDDLDRVVRNSSPNLRYNHFTGVNTHYLRFLENHDETRIAEEFDLARAKAAAALLFSIPGIPLIYAGQEVGETSRRGQIDWNRTGAGTTFAFYQRLAAIRNTFSTFRSPEIKRIASQQQSVYAFLRPQTDQNGVGVINLSNANVTASLTIDEDDLRLQGDSLRTGVTYYLNDVLNNTPYPITKSTISEFEIDLQPWGSAILVLADSVIELVTSVSVPNAIDTPRDFGLFQNYPNPFNPATTLQFELPRSAEVVIEIFNVLGQRVQTVLSASRPAGVFTVSWDGKDDRSVEISSGVYIARIQAKADLGTSFVRSIKLIKMK